MSDNEIFLVIKKVDGEIKAHAIFHGKIDKAELESAFSEFDNKNSEVEIDKTENHTDPEQISDLSPFPESFHEVERSFSQTMLMYRKSVVETIKFAPFFANLRLSFDVEKVAKTRGTKSAELSMENVDVYSLPNHAFGSIKRHKDRSEALIEGAQHLPKISIIGIISSYDAILSDLLRVIFKHKPEIIFTSDREVNFSDLIELKSLEAVRDSIISNEIEGVIRNSHHEQFSWMEKKFGMKLREGLKIWPDFIELCERRNLLTHTGGVVSEQYLKNCEKLGNKAKHQVGEKLEIDIEYLKSAIDIVSEVGYKLIHTMWRKFLPEGRERADSVLNSTGMDLIAAGEYKLAGDLLRFGVGQKQHSSDLIKRMMIVNLANAAKLDGDTIQSEEALSSQDWSATSYQFQICVAAVRNDFEEVKRLMRLGGGVIDITPSDFRDWPVFQDARNDTEVRLAFEEVFGEPLEKDNDKISIEKTMPDDAIEDARSEEDRILS